MPFSEKQTNVLSILTLILLVSLIVYASSLSPRGARAYTGHRKTSESLDEAVAITPMRHDGEPRPVVLRSRDAGGMPEARAEPAEADDLITVLLRQCISTNSCPAWASSGHSPDAGHH